MPPSGLSLLCDQRASQPLSWRLAGARIRRTIATSPPPPGSNGPPIMNSSLVRFFSAFTLCTLSIGTPVASAQSLAPLVVSTEERCAFNRVDDESLPLALENCTATAESGDMQAQFEMGELYYHGERTERDLQQALKWYEQASVQGHPDAQYR